MSRFSLSKTNLSSAPLLPIAVGFAAGIAIQTAWPGPVSLIIFCLLPVITLKAGRIYMLMTVCALLGYTDSMVHTPNHTETTLTGNKLFYSGDVVQVSASESAQKLTFRITGAGLQRQHMRSIPDMDVMLTYPGYSSEFSPGQSLLLHTTLHAVTTDTDLPQEITPSHFLLRNRIINEALITDSDIISMTRAKGCKAFFHDLNRRALQAVGESGLSPEVKSFLNATLLGDRNSIPQQTRQEFNATGLSHILAISGLHVGIIALMASIAFFPMLFLNLKRWRSIPVIITLWMFALLTGMAPSVVRATVMATIFLIGQLLQRKSSPLNSLSLSAVIILLFDPVSLFSIGFQLSYAAVLSIIIFAGRINPISPGTRLPYKIAAFLCTTLSAMLGTGLLSVIYFHTFPIYFLIANAMASLLLPLILCGGIVVITCVTLSIPHHVITVSVNSLYSILESTIDTIISLPGPSFSNIYLPEWTIIPFAACVICLKLALDKPCRKSFAVLTISTTVLVVTLSIPHNRETEHRIYLSRDKQHTELLYPWADSLILISTTPTEPLNVSGRAEFRYADYMVQRGISKIHIDTANRRSDRIIRTSTLAIGLLSGKEYGIDSVKLTHAILCRGFRNNIESVISKHRPDTIIIANDIHPARAGHYIEQCDTLGVPCIWTRNQRWSMAYGNSSKPIVK